MKPQFHTIKPEQVEVGDEIFAGEGWQEVLSIVSDKEKLWATCSFRTYPIESGAKIRRQRPCHAREHFVIGTPQESYGVKVTTKSCKDYEFPEPPDGESWHNPEEFSAERVGEGYRLLVEVEVPNVKSIKGAQFFYDGGWHSFREYEYAMSHWTYRVPENTPIQKGGPEKADKYYGYFSEHQGAKSVVAKREDGHYNIYYSNGIVGTVTNFKFLEAFGLEQNLKEFDSLDQLMKWYHEKD